MRLAFAVASLLLVAAAAGAQTAAPVHIDELVEMPLASLQRWFPQLKSEGCYQLAAGQFLQISIDRKDQKPWRVTLSAEAPCRKPETATALEVRARSGVRLGDSTRDIVQRLGRPDTSMAPDAKQKKLGATEYFYICRVSDGCARHTSVFVTDGVVTAISEWYSE
jgi:hypothetical protein